MRPIFQAPIIRKGRAGRLSIILVYQDMPSAVRALTHANDDGSYAILINSRLCYERQIEAVLHELTHIQGNDFTSEEQADLLEQMLHTQKQYNVDLSEFVFFTA